MAGATGPWNEAGQWPILVHKPDLGCSGSPRVPVGEVGGNEPGDFKWYIYTAMYKIGLSGGSG